MTVLAAPLWAFDLILALGLVTVAWTSLNGAGLFRSVVLFIAFGLLMALAWVRLDATDVALAEAAIGAGITGALLLDALGHIAGEPGQTQSEPVGHYADDGQASPAASWMLLGLSVIVAGLVGAAVWSLPPERAVTADAAFAALDGHPIGNAANAVLLDFRAYDTFLELGVLALAAFGAFILKASAMRTEQAQPPAEGSIMLITLARWLVPLMALVAAYLFWAGASRSGGAFPAGAMLGAAGVVLFLAGIGRDAVADRSWTRLPMVLGFAVFLFAGLATMLAGRAFLDWPGGWTYGIIVALEAVLTLSIGGTLALLYAASAKDPPDTGPASGSRWGERP